MGFLSGEEHIERDGRPCLLKVKLQRGLSAFEHGRCHGTESHKMNYASANIILALKECKS